MGNIEAFHMSRFGRQCEQALQAFNGLTLIVGAQQIPLKFTRALGRPLECIDPVAQRGSLLIVALLRSGSHLFF